MEISTDLIKTCGQLPTESVIGTHLQKKIMIPLIITNTVFFTHTALHIKYTEI